MALGDNTLAAARGSSSRGRSPYMVQTVVNLATALSDKGSALAAGDVIPVIAVPAGTMIMNAGIEVDTVTSGGTTTFDLGTGVDADCFVDGMDGSDSVAAGTISQNAAAYQPLIAVAADNIDLKLATQSGTALTTGKLRVYAVLMDIADTGIEVGTEVDRDRLA